MTYKERQTESLRKTQDELIRKIEALPIFQSDISMTSVRIKFAVDEVVELLDKTEWTDPQPLISIEQTAVDNLRKETPEITEVRV